jgi:hypothetical protein
MRRLNRGRAWRLELWSVFKIQGGRNRKSTGWFRELGKRRDHEKGGCAFGKTGGSGRGVLAT